MDISKEDLRLLHDTLQAIKESGPVEDKMGICYNVLEKSHVDFYVKIGELSEGWPNHSGRFLFPVPRTIDAKYDSLWDLNTEHGRLRWELLDYLIEKTKPGKKGDVSSTP